MTPTSKLLFVTEEHWIKDVGRWEGVVRRRQLKSSSLSEAMTTIFLKKK